jgi:hypothetical protein
LNGVALRSTAPDELSKLGIKIRMLLVIEPQLVKDAKLWLLLALDLFSVRFGVLPTEIYKYYEEQLGSIAMSSFPVSAKRIYIFCFSQGYGKKR